MQKSKSLQHISKKSIPQFKTKLLTNLGLSLDFAGEELEACHEMLLEYLLAHRRSIPFQLAMCVWLSVLIIFMHIHAFKCI